MNPIPAGEKSSNTSETSATPLRGTSKATMISLTLLAFLVGLGVGCYAGFRLVRHYTPTFPTANQRIAESLAFQVSHTVSILERLQNPNPTNTVKRIEIELTGALKLMEMNLKSHPDSARDQNVLKALQAVKEYRAKFPSSKLVEIENGLTRLLDQHMSATNRN